MSFEHWVWTMVWNAKLTTQRTKRLSSSCDEKPSIMFCQPHLHTREANHEQKMSCKIRINSENKVDCHKCWRVWYMECQADNEPQNHHLVMKSHQRKPAKSIRLRCWSWSGPPFFKVCYSCEVTSHLSHSHWPQPLGTSHASCEPFRSRPQPACATSGLPSWQTPGWKKMGGTLNIGHARK